MTQKKEGIKVALHMPENEHALRQFEKRICEFYSAQVERRLSALPKEKQLEVLDIIISGLPY